MKIRKVKKYRIWKEEQIAKLEDDLQWHAKSFALRLMVGTASKTKIRAPAHADVDSQIATAPMPICKTLTQVGDFVPIILVVVI